mgnify:CR=1 FL=1
MKEWSEAKDKMVVYIRNPFDYKDAKGAIQYTPKMQKAIVNCHADSADPETCTAVIAQGGIADGITFYFYHDEFSPEGLLTESEYQKNK